MRTIIAGSRSITDFGIVSRAVVASGFEISCVICGCARGVDSLGERWALENNIPVERFPADWRRFGRSAGIIRNRQMAQRADALVLIWDGYSSGSADMLRTAQAHGLRVFSFVVGSDGLQLF